MRIRAPVGVAARGMARADPHVARGSVLDPPAELPEA
jgi:hypothetical protein